MPRPLKRKKRGLPFVPGDPRRCNGNAPVDESPPPKRIRESKTVFDHESQRIGSVPPGATLRPYSDASKSAQTLQNAIGDSDSENWVVDQKYLLDAMNHALESHNSSKNRCNHTAKLQKKNVNKNGFGIQASFHCGYRNCKFESKLYNLYPCNPMGQPLTNIQVGIALSKTDLTPNTVETLATTLNIHPPSLTTLKKSYNQALNHSEQLAESAMADNRHEVTSTLRLRGEVEKDAIPSVDVAIDGQFSNRSYHFPNGKSDSVSVPVVEQVTGKGLIIQHVNVGHRDGTLPSNIHINSGETLAARMAYEQTHQADKFPLHFGVVTTDGDTGLLKALEMGRMNVGESRPLKRRGCYFHGESAAKRKFNRESLTRLTTAQKSQLEQGDITFPTDLSPNTCPACKKTFKPSKGLNIHRRSCKGEKAEEMNVRGLEPLFFAWEKNPNKGKLTVKAKKEWRDGIRVWLIKRMKQELNLGLFAANPENAKIENDRDIRDSLFLAGQTIVNCLSGEHDRCLMDARGCDGSESLSQYDLLPSKSAIGPIPSPTASWLNSVVGMILSRDALESLVVDGRKATTSLVESAHKEIRIPIPKGRVYRKNESKLIKSGCICLSREKALHILIAYSLYLLVFLSLSVFLSFCLFLSTPFSIATFLPHSAVSALHIYKRVSLHT